MTRDAFSLNYERFIAFIGMAAGYFAAVVSGGSWEWGMIPTSFAAIAFIAMWKHA